MDDTLDDHSEPPPIAPPEPTVVNYYFPVEIVVAGRLADQERELIQAQIYRDLHEAIIDQLG